MQIKATTNLIRQKSRSAANLTRLPEEDGGRRKVSAEELLAAKERLRRVPAPSRSFEPTLGGREEAKRPVASVPQLSLAQTPVHKAKTTPNGIAVLAAPAVSSKPPKAPSPPELKNFIRDNVEAAAEMKQLKRSKSHLTLEAAQARKQELLERHKAGEVPKYLRDRFPSLRITED